MARAMAALRRTLLPLACAALSIAASGCVERLLEVRSEPPGATVFVNGREVGTTPLEHPFSFYGTVSVVLRREGHSSRKIVQELDPPWYEYFPLDFVADVVVPWKVTDRHLLEARLEPLPEEIGDREWRALEERAGEARGQAEAAQDS
jgi:hypothetical protein